MTPTCELGWDLCTVHLREVSSSCVYSSTSYRVAKQTNRRRWKHPTLFATLRRWVKIDAALNHEDALVCIVNEWVVTECVWSISWTDLALTRSRLSENKTRFDVVVVATAAAGEVTVYGCRNAFGLQRLKAPMSLISPCVADDARH